MKLRVFYADKGDCLLLTSDGKENILIDGGPKRKTFDARTIRTLQELADAGQRVDLVVVSHIDQDHITGVIDLVGRFIAWRQHDFDIDPDGGNQPGTPEPTFDRPPEILQMWHNSWKQHLGGLASKVSAVVNQVAATAADAAATDSEAEAVEALSSLASSIGEASQLQDLVDTVPSPIARNKGFADSLVTLTDPPVTKKLGSLTLTLLGPSDEQLESLREFWRQALHLPKTVAGPGLNVGGAALAVDEFDLAAAVDVEQTAVDLVQSVAADFAVNIATGTIGDIGPVTEANRASIIVLAEEGRRKKKGHRSCLLTGDATHVDIVGGLEAAGLLDEGVFWCDIHKFQHHGSEHNADEKFASTVLAKHYVFSANGEHDNPDSRIVELLIRGRAEKAPDVPFTVWFTCSVEEAEPKFQPKVREALNAAVDAAADANASTKGLVTIRVLTAGEPFFDICLCLPGVDCDCASPSSSTTKLTERIPDDQ